MGAAALIVVGVPWHFAYAWSHGNRVLAALAPANESVWEHLKLVLVPVLVLGLVEARYVSDRRRLWWAKLVEVIAACTFIVVAFYTYTGAFGVDSVLVVDIATFVVAVAGGQWLSWRILGSPRGAPVPATVSVVGLLLLVALFAVLTFAPPHIPLFQDAVTGGYGPA